MGKRERAARGRYSGAHAGQAGEVVFLPQGIELELVGIIGSLEGCEDLNAMDAVLLDGDEDLLALVESLREDARVGQSGSARGVAGARQARCPLPN